MEPPQYPPGRQLPGTVYRVVRHLATGGMGSVYDVEDVTVGKRYVLKTLHPQLVSRQDLARRMEAEARALAKLQHPNIVDVVTAGVTTDEKRMPFYVMERLNGQNLRVVIEKKGSLEITHCFRIAIDVLDALEHAHENAVIHRDVKPENIFLHRNTNGTTTTKLLDFGIMRLLDRKASHTQGKFIGTLRYASPEQIFGGELGPPTDIYSLGVVLYEMIAGRGPFDDVGDAYAIGAAHAQQPPPPLSRFVSVSQSLERLVMSSLAKAPHERPRDCFSFARELRLMLREEEASPRSATAINVLSSVPQTRDASALPLAGTELSSDPPPQSPAGAVTDLGMMPPSAVDAAMLPPTVRESAGRARISSAPGALPPGAVAPGAVGPTDIGVASTLASEPGANPVRDGGARASSVPGAKPMIDRAAETRASGGSGVTQRLAQNGTAIDDGAPPLLPDDAVRAALAQREMLEVPPTSGTPYDPRNSDIVFPATHGLASGTGPLAAEARTRPPERGMVLPLIGAAVLGAVLVGGAVLLVTKPWRHAAVIGPPPVADPPAAPATSTAVVVQPASTSPTLTPAVVPNSVPSTESPARAGVGVVTPARAPAPRAGAGTAAPRTAPSAATTAGATTTAATPPGSARKPARPPAGAPRPEDVGFE